MSTLILTRKVGERICITVPDGREVWVEVIEKQHGGLCLGVTADPDIRVDREEVKVARERAALQSRLEAAARAAADTAIVPQAAICRQHTEAVAVAVTEADGEPD
jgi:sRNA-binding carbon storage regulator CsrA